MEKIVLKSLEKIFEFKIKSSSIYGIYDDNVTFGDAVNAFFENYYYAGNDVNKYSFYSEHLKKYITEMDLSKKISSYNMPKKTIINVSYNKGNKWTSKDSNELYTKYENVDINIKIYDKSNRKNIKYNSEFKINVHYLSGLAKINNIINEKTKLLLNEYKLYFKDKIISTETIFDSHINHGNTINLIKKSKWELKKERMFNINIKNGNEIIKCDVNKYLKILDIKNKILEKNRVSVSQQCLKYLDKELDDNDLIYIHKIKKDSTLKLTIKNNDTKMMKIFLIPLSGGLKTMIVNNLMTTNDIKYLVFQMEGVPMDKQRLIHSGRQLEDNYKITDYNIYDCHTIHLLLRLKGGMYHETSGRNGGFQPLKKILFKITSEKN
jgi:Ubiquitin family.